MRTHARYMWNLSFHIVDSSLSWFSSALKPIPSHTINNTLRAIHFAFSPITRQFLRRSNQLIFCLMCIARACYFFLSRYLATFRVPFFLFSFLQSIIYSGSSPIISHVSCSYQYPICLVVSSDLCLFASPTPSLSTTSGKFCVSVSYLLSPKTSLPIVSRFLFFSRRLYSSHSIGATLSLCLTTCIHS